MNIKILSTLVTLLFHRCLHGLDERVTLNPVTKFRACRG